MGAVAQIARGKPVSGSGRYEAGYSDGGVDWECRKITVPNEIATLGVRHQTQR